MVEIVNYDEEQESRCRTTNSLLLITSIVGGEYEIGNVTTGGYELSRKRSPKQIDLP